MHILLLMDILDYQIPPKKLSYLYSVNTDTAEQYGTERKKINKEVSKFNKFIVDY